jgi:hypothetical protein
MPLLLSLFLPFSIDFSSSEHAFEYFHVRSLRLYIDFKGGFLYPNEQSIKIFGMFFALALALIFSAPPAFAAVTAVNVGGANHTDTATTGSSGSGWAWTVTPPTLTLDSAYNTEAKSIDIRCNPADTVILVILETGTGIVDVAYVTTTGSLEVSGSGTLNLPGTAYAALYAAEDITINANVTTSGNFDNGIYASRDVTISGGTVTAECKR